VIVQGNALIAEKGITLELLQHFICSGPDFMLLGLFYQILPEIGVCYGNELFCSHPER
jgi:hypothetical protein